MTIDTTVEGFAQHKTNEILDFVAYWNLHRSRESDKFPAYMPMSEFEEQFLVWSAEMYPSSKEKTGNG